eukprot:scaffold117158_cov32-Tisochrysis_lutea.AAC.1
MLAMLAASYIHKSKQLIAAIDIGGQPPVGSRKNLTLDGRWAISTAKRLRGAFELTLFFTTTTTNN